MTDKPDDIDDIMDAFWEDRLNIWRANRFKRPASINAWWNDSSWEPPPKSEHDDHLIPVLTNFGSSYGPYECGVACRKCKQQFEHGKRENEKGEWVFKTVQPWEVPCIEGVVSGK